MNMENVYDVIVVGGGPAGLSSATSAKCSGAKQVLVIERENWLGGILPQCIHTGFGLMEFKEELTGPEYASRWIRKARDAGVSFLLNTAVLSISRSIDSDNTREVTVSGELTGIRKIRARAIILAMGCREKPLGSIGIPGNRCAGIFTAGSAQRLVNIEGVMPGREVVILGSGDIGLIMARRITLEGGRVRMVCERMDHPGGLERNVIQCLEDYNIPLLLSSTILEIHGQKRVEAVTVGQFDPTGTLLPDSVRKIQCDTVLLSVGLIPENELSVAAGVRLDPRTRGPIVDSYMQTEQPGVFACGNVLKVYDLVDEVSREAILTGEFASAYANGTLSAMEGMRTDQGQSKEKGKDQESNPANILQRQQSQNSNEGRRITCTVCPIGCVLTIRFLPGTKPVVEGYSCKRGLKYAQDEMISPVRTLTTCAWTEEIIEEEGTKKVRRREIAVRTDRPIPLRKMIQAAAIIRSYQIRKKVQQGEVLKRNLARTQANVIVTRE